jgi:hypothetical protein
MYTFECEDKDFSQKVIDAIEFSNQAWNEWKHMSNKMEY